VRVYPQMVSLITAAREAGLDVWIVSASAQPLVEELAGRVGIAPDRGVGGRMQVGEDGKLTSTPQPCGNTSSEVMTYHEGKRCWINKVILGLPEAEQLAPTPSQLAPVLVAGDSDTDLAMLQDATGLRLVINRQRPLLMCHALGDGDSR